MDDLKPWYVGAMETTKDWAPHRTWYIEHLYCISWVFVHVYHPRCGHRTRELPQHTPLPLHLPHVHSVRIHSTPPPPPPPGIITSHMETTGTIQICSQAAIFIWAGKFLKWQSWLASLRIVSQALNSGHSPFPKPYEQESISQSNFYHCLIEEFWRERSRRKQTNIGRRSDKSCLRDWQINCGVSCSI